MQQPDTAPYAAVTPPVPSFADQLAATLAAAHDPDVSPFLRAAVAALNGMARKGGNPSAADVIAVVATSVSIMDGVLVEMATPRPVGV